MLLYLYATCVAAVLFNFGISTPIPQDTNPIFACPQGYQSLNGECKQIICPPTHYLQNNMCYLKVETNQPNLSVQPCQLANSQCQTVVSQPCRVGTPSCHTPVAPIPVVTQPCSVGTPSCQTAVAPIPVVTQPCTVGTPSCETPVAPIQVVTQPCTAVSTSCQTVVAPVPVTQPCQIGYPLCQLVTPQTTQRPGPVPSSTTPQPTKRPAPDPSIRCSKGSILINGYCHLIYCGRGIYRDGKCIQTVCPEGTVWTGSRCETPTPQNHTTVHMSNVIITNVNQTDVNRGINFTNNMVIYITETPVIEVTLPPATPSPITTPTPTTSPPGNCCVVITPNACMWEGDHYVCRSRKYRRCGSICTNGYIYLRPPTVQPPPPPELCMENDCGYDHKPFYPDCSGCDYTLNENCLTYCRRSVCQTRRCQSVDLRGYCVSYPGSIGCRPVDGCMQDWCGGY